MLRDRFYVLRLSLLTGAMSLVAAAFALQQPLAAVFPSMSGPAHDLVSTTPAERLADRVDRLADASEDGHYIVVLKGSVEHPAAVARAQATQTDAKVGFVYRSALTGYSATIPRDEVKALGEDPKVDYVSVDHQVKVLSQSTPTGVERINANMNESLHVDGKENTRVNVDVAVIDTGIDYEHSDLSVFVRADCLGGQCVEETGSDGQGHGTHVAGTIGALDNGIGVTGVAPGARLWAVKVLDSNGEGTESSIIAGIDWVTARSDRIEVANMSLGGVGAGVAVDEAIHASAEAGVVYVVAAGNSHGNVKDFFPANSPDVITVSALADYDGKAGGKSSPTCNSQGADDTLASFSNFGSGVDVAAPGVCILSTVPGNGYGVKSGTSMASPHVAGAAAILASEDNPENLRDVESIRETIEAEGNSAWTDTSGDGATEPLLDVGNATTFAATAQVASTGAAENLSEDEESLNGEINPFGVETKYQFEYGPSPSYGSAAPTSPVIVGSGEGFTPVKYTIKGLNGQTPYHYRLVAINNRGTFYGPDRTFATTMPNLETEAPDGVNGWEAIVHGTVLPEGSPTHYSFEFGETTEYGRRFPNSWKDAGAGTLQVEGEQRIGGLQSGKTYHYRIVAINLAGKTYGEDRAFVTDTPDWTAQAVIDPSSESWPESAFADVACPTADDCMAVGGKWSKEAEQPLAEHWNGIKWEQVSIPDIDEAFGLLLPSAFLTDVACSSPEWCVAAGTAILNNQLQRRPFVLEWNGEKWSLDQLASETAWFDYSVWPEDVSCASAVNCVIVGSSEGSEGAAFAGWSITWDGSNWSHKDPPVPAGTFESLFPSVSCLSNGPCIASGVYNASPFNGTALIEEWNGEAWSLKAPRERNMFDEISCLSAGEVPECRATSVGLPYLLGKTDWENLPIPSAPVSAKEALVYWRDIECVSTASCSMLGVYFSVAGYSPSPIVAHWDGEGWTLESSQYGTPGTGSASGGWLESVSCSAADVCTAVGARSTPDGLARPLAVRRARPAVATEAATVVKASEVTLNATVDPEGSPTTYYFEYGKTTSYGTKIPISTASVGSGTSAVVVAHTPSSLAKGTIYHYRVVAENNVGRSNGQDEVFETVMPSATFDFAFGTHGSGNGQFKDPIGVAADSKGNVWVGDSSNHRIQKFTSTGEYLTQVAYPGLWPEGVAIDSNGNPQVNEGGIAIDAKGNRWITKPSENTVQEYNSAGEYQRQFGSEGTGNGEFRYPFGIAIDAKGNIWVADSENSRIEEFNSAGEYLSQFGSEGSGNGEFQEAFGIAIDAEGHLWVTDQGNSRVEEFNSDGEYLSQFAGSSGSGQGEFTFPYSIAIDAEGNFWIPDIAHSRVEEWSP